MRRSFLILCACLVAAAATVMATRALASENTSLVGSAQDPIDGCGWCGNCWGGHDMDAVGDKVYHTCLNIVCQEHASCSGGLRADGLRQVWLAAREMDAAEAEAVFEKYSPYLIFNEARKAIQVKSCGQLIAHVPLAESQVAAFEAALNN